jgi:uncharacterized protein YqfB (UPF0267 family)
MIITKLEKNAGFYSQFFFLVNHYLYAKKHNLKFKVESSNWLFRYNKGWEDYFKNIDITEANVCNDEYFCHHQQIDDFTITEYKNIIKEIYVYNDNIKNIIEITKKKLSLKDYDSIFIRRGDKLSGESNYICTEKYIEVLLNKNPNCHTIFLQTDDYNCYLELKNYVFENKLNINIITLCKEETKGGMIIFNCNKVGIEWAVKEHSLNKEYILSVIENLRNFTPIDKLDNDQVYEHTIEMIVGIDIVLNSNISICDFSSNVSRFIKLAHNNSKNVYDVTNEENDIDWSKTRCPAFELLF